MESGPGRGRGGSNLGLEPAPILPGTPGCKTRHKELTRTVVPTTQADHL